MFYLLTKPVNQLKFHAIQTIKFIKHTNNQYIMQKSCLITKICKNMSSTSSTNSSATKTSSYSRSIELTFAIIFPLSIMES